MVGFGGGRGKVLGVEEVQRWGRGEGGGRREEG